MSKNFIFFDIETTGLDPSEDSILEVAAVAMDSKFNVLGEYKAVIEHTYFDDMNEKVFNMHTKNGLLDECSKSKLSLRQVEEHLVTWTEELNLGEKPILAGNSIHFDKSFVREHMPKFDEILHYRLLDVSSIKEMLKNFYNFEVRKLEGNHRAVRDVYDSIEEFRKYVTVLRIDMAPAY